MLGACRRRLRLAGCRELCSCAAASSRVRRVYGSQVQELPQFALPLDGPGARHWPGEYPLELCRKAFGIDLGVSPEHFRRNMLEAVESGLHARPCGAEDCSEWLQTGRSNGSPSEFVALGIPPRTSFFVHQHPGIELVYLVKGSMHEVRLEEPAHIDRSCTTPHAPYDLRDPSYRFQRREFRAGQGGRWLANEVGSVHQTFTEDEECLMIALWPGRYVIFRDEQLPRDVFVPVNHHIDNEDRGDFKHGERHICW